MAELSSELIAGLRRVLTSYVTVNVLTGLWNVELTVMSLPFERILRHLHIIRMNHFFSAETPGQQGNGQVDPHPRPGLLLSKWKRCRYSGKPSASSPPHPTADCLMPLSLDL